MKPCDCGLDHTGPCQDAIRKHYEGEIKRLKRAMRSHAKRLKKLSGIHHQLHPFELWIELRDMASELFSETTCELDEALKERE